MFLQFNKLFLKFLIDLFYLLLIELILFYEGKEKFQKLLIFTFNELIRKCGYLILLMKFNLPQVIELNFALTN